MSLKHWWQLNGSLVDCIGGNDLVASGAFSSNDSGKIGRCYFASATSAYAASKNAIYRDGDLSLCFWFKLTAYSSSPTALVTMHDHSTTSCLGLNLGTNNKLGVSIGYTDGSREWAGRNSTTVIALNVWYHACLTYNKAENRVTVYVNGVKENSEVLTKTVKFAANKLTVNRWSINYNGYMTTGYFNDVRFYDHTLSAKEIKEIAKANILHYNFNNIIDTNVRDSSGFKNHGKLVSGCSPTSSTESVMGSKSLLFANASKQSNGLYQHAKSNSTVYIPEQGTLSYYIKYDTTNYAENGDNKYAVGYANFCSMNNTTALGMIYYYDASNYQTRITSNNSKDGKWHMHTISWDKETKAFKNYLDGVLIQTTTATGFQHAGTFRDFIVGSAWSTGYGGHSGYLDDVKVYATVLSDTDVKELYETKGSVSKNGKMFINEIVEDTERTTNNVSKKGILNTNEIIEVDNCSMKTKTELSANWVRIFYHNSKAGTVMFDKNNKNEFLRCHTEDKQSDLWALEQFRGKDGKFELMLQYQNSTGYNRWKQTSNFTKETTITGYEAVQVSWTTQNWGGLALSSTPTNTWVDGSPGAGTWYYAIGPVVTYQGGMPNQNTVETGWVEIWVRCDDINLFRMIKNGKCKATEFIEI